MVDRKVDMKKYRELAMRNKARVQTYAVRGAM
jgi:hypothetical protein